MVPMFLEDMQFDGADSGAITWGDEIPDAAKAGVTGRRDRLRPVRHPRRDPADAGRPARSRSSRRTRARAAPGGRTGTRVRGSTSGATTTATRSSRRTTGREYFCRQPELRDYFDARARQVRAPAALPLRHRGDGPHLGRAVEHVARRQSATPTAPPRPSRPASSSARSGRSTSRGCPTSPASTTSPARRSTRPAGPTDSTSPASGSRSSVPAQAASRSHRPSPTRSRTSTSSSAPTQWMLPNPMYHAAVPPGDRWAMRHLPFYARWFRFLMLYPGIGMGTEQYRVDPDFRGRRGHRRSTRRTRRGAGS